MDESILKELQAITKKLERLDVVESKLERLDVVEDKLDGVEKRLEGLEGIEKTVKKTQKDITDIKRYLEIGVDEDYRRLKERVATLEKKVL